MPVQTNKFKMPFKTAGGPLPPVSQQSNRVATFEDVLDDVYGHRIVIYGPGGIGKSTLACLAPGEVVFFDLDESLRKLKPQLAASSIPLPKVIGRASCEDWAMLRGALQSSGWDKVKTIVFDTGGRLEELALAHTLANVKGEKNKICHKVEDYGYGKGYRYVYDTFLPLLGDLDRHVRSGRNVILICHDDIKTVPNPAGLDWIRWEPKLQDSKGSSIRLKVKEWSDHTLFFGYDVEVDDQGNERARVGKGQGSGTRTIWTSERPHFMAKSRTTSDQIPIGPDVDVWSQIIK